MNSIQKQALKDAADVLETEANQLADELEACGAKLSMRTGVRDEINAFPPKNVPHRIAIALRNEMRRLRDLATTLRKMVPTPRRREDSEE